MELALSNMDRQGKPSPLELAEITKNTELKQVHCLRHKILTVY